jgi:Protein of unknown function (DUF3999)
MKISIVLLTLIPAVAHAQGPSGYAYGVAIDAPPAIAYARLAIPPAVYEGVVHRDLSDMRIFNADGEVVPYAFVPRTYEHAPLARVPLRMFPLYVSRDRGNVDDLALSVVRNANGTTINVTSRDGDAAQERALGGYVLDASEYYDPIAALTFEMPATSAATSMRMRIDGSDDLVSWRSLRSDATLVLLEQGGHRLERNRVEISPAKAKYLRVSWTTGAPAIAFTGVAGEFGRRPVEPAREWRTATGTPVEGREGEYQYDLGGAFPIDRIALDLTAPNSIVPATLLGRDVATDPWQLVGSTVFYRIAQPPTAGADGTSQIAMAATDTTSPPFAVDGRARRYWLLRLDPRAGVSGLTGPVLRAGWQPQEIVFPARGRGPFVLAYGKYEATPGSLPIETLIPDYANKRELPESVVVARTAARVDLGGSTRLLKPPDTKRWVLWGALLLGAAVLGWMAWRLSRDLTKGESASSSANSDRV